MATKSIVFTDLASSFFGVLRFPTRPLRLAFVLERLLLAEKACQFN